MKHPASRAQPDLGIEKLQARITPEETQAIAKGLGFKEGFPLHAEFVEAEEFYQLAQHRHDKGHRPKGRREAMLEIADISLALSTALRALPFDSYVALTLERHSLPGWRPGLASRLQALKMAARMTARQTPPDRGGRKPSAETKVFVRLANVYRRGTGRDPRKALGHDWGAGEEHTGEFVTFVKRFLKAVGARRRTNGALRKALGKAFEAAARTSGT